MPEITSIEAMQAKLRQFDEQMEAAIGSAKMLSRIRSDAQKLLNDAENACSRSDAAFQKAEGIRLALQQAHQEWDCLKRECHKSQMDSQETRDLLLSELDSALQSLDTKVTEAEERLRTTNRASLQEHEEALQRLEGDTRANAEVASSARATTVKAAQDAENLVKQARDALHNDIQDNLNHAQDSLNSQFQAGQKDLLDRLEATIGEISAFKEEMRHGLKVHQQAIDRELTDFLNKQNALVQNLTQQIDGFHRLAQTVSADLTQTKAQLAALETSVKIQKEEWDAHAASLAAKITQVSTQLDSTIAALKRRSLFTGLK